MNMSGISKLNIIKKNETYPTRVVSFFSFIRTFREVCHIAKGSNMTPPLTKTLNKYIPL